MSADTLPDDALDLALEGFAGTYADGTPLSVTDALLAALLAAAPSVSAQQRAQIRELAIATGAVCTWHGELRPFADLLGGTGESGGEDEASSPVAAELAPAEMPGQLPFPGGGPVTRWGPYVEQRLGELERGEGDYTGLQRPSAGAVMMAREVAASVFREGTPTPSVVPTESGDVAFIWHKNGVDAELDVNETEADLWMHDRASGEMWSGPVADHRGCCVARLLDRLEEAAP